MNINSKFKLNEKLSFDGKVFKIIKRMAIIDLDMGEKYTSINYSVKDCINGTYYNMTEGEIVEELRIEKLKYTS